MGNDKEDTGFGFKDKAKAEETLRLLEEHELGYRRLTVRGLLGRARRVLTMTKAEEKIRNIKEAMEVFENWLAELDQNREKKTERKRVREDTEEQAGGVGQGSDVEKEETPKKKDLPSDTVPGLGFKDKAAAEGTLQELEGRDPDYQKLAVKGLIGRAKRVLTCTRDETKLSNINEAISIFDKFLEDFDKTHLSKHNNPYVGLDIVSACLDKAGEEAPEIQRAFVAAYGAAGGEHKRLRTMRPADGGRTWDIVRNEALQLLKNKHSKAILFNDNDEPTKEHLEMLLWAYSPEAARVERVTPGPNARKRRGGAADSPSKRRK